MLGYGRIKAKPYYQLMKEMGVTTRTPLQIRISRARRLGYLVANMRDGAGYFLADTLAEIAAEGRFRLDFTQAVVLNTTPYIEEMTRRLQAGHLTLLPRERDQVKKLTQQLNRLLTAAQSP